MLFRRSKIFCQSMLFRFACLKAKLLCSMQLEESVHVPVYI